MRVASLLVGGLLILGVGSSASQSQPSGLPVIDGAVPFTPYGAAFVVVRFAPDAVTRENLVRVTEQHIYREQTLWSVLGRNVEALGPGRWFRKVFGQKPDNPDVIYEWQAVAEEKSNPVRDQLLNLFLSPDASAKGVADVFLFSRKQVEDRLPRYAAQELLPVFEQHLRLVAAKAPVAFWLSVPLPRFEYDFQAKAIRFSTVETGRPARGSVPTDGIDLFNLPGRDYPLPARAAGTATYLTSRAVQFMRRGQSAAASSKSESPTHAWRNAFTIGSSADPVPAAMVLASDRQLRLASIPMDVKLAEQLEKNSATDQLSARVFVTVDGVEVVTNRIGRSDEYRLAVLFVRVRKVDVIGPEDKVLHSIAGSSLPAPAVTAPPPQAAGSAAQSKPPAPTESGAAVVENLRKQSEAEMKRSNCKVEAMKVNPDEKSTAHRQKYAACMKAG